MVIGLNDGCGDGDRDGGRGRVAGGVAGADALAALRVIRIWRSRVMVLMIRDFRRLGRTGVQPLHRAPAHSRGEEHQSKRHDSAAAEERYHG